MTVNKALFLDRDGIINQRLIGGYVRTPEEFVLLTDVIPILRKARTLGYRLILITNQQGVGKGLMTTQDLDRVNQAMQAKLGTSQAQLDDIYACTDLATSGSTRRKPQPGMLLEAISRHALDPSSCWFLGDSLTDAQAGRAAGVHTALVGDHHRESADIVAPSLLEITEPLCTALTTESAAATYR